MENCEVGSRVIVIVSSTDDNAVVTVYSKDRTMAIYLFVLFLSGDMYDRWEKGVKAIASLAFTGVCIVYLMFPLMYRGISPIGITIVVVILSTLLTLWLLGGVSKRRYLQWWERSAVWLWQPQPQLCLEKPQALPGIMCLISKR